MNKIHLRLLWLCLGVLCLEAAQAQFSVNLCNVPAVRNGAVDMADYDRDGDQDILITGLLENGTPIMQLYKYEQTNLITRPMSPLISSAVYTLFPFVNRPVFRSAVAWGDYNDDTYPDLLVTGLTAERVTTDSVRIRPVTVLYTNLGGITFAPNSDVSFPDLFDGAIAWGDYDADGDLDLALSGDTEEERLTRIYRNTDGAFSEVNTTLTGVSGGSLDWGDYDADGDLDLLVTGFAASDVAKTFLYRNDGDDAFVLQTTTLPDFAFSKARWGDLDADGDDDILLTGGVLDPNLVLGVTRVYRNEGGTFEEIDSAFDGAFTGSADWGDFDGDGDLDILIMGLQKLVGEDQEITRVYLNRRGSFRLSLSLRGTRYGFARMYDYDADNIMDLMIFGVQENVTDGVRNEVLIKSVWEQRAPDGTEGPVVPPENACQVGAN